MTLPLNSYHSQLHQITTTPTTITSQSEIKWKSSTEIVSAFYSFVQGFLFIFSITFLSSGLMNLCCYFKIYSTYVCMTFSYGIMTVVQTHYRFASILKYYNKLRNNHPHLFHSVDKSDVQHLTNRSKTALIKMFNTFITIHTTLPAAIYSGVL